MKFGKVAQLVLAIGIFAIAAVFLYQMYQGRQGEYEEINTQMAASQTLLLKLESEKSDLEGELSSAQVELEQAQASLGEGKAKFPEQAVESIEYGELFFEMAHDRNLELLRLSATEPAEVNLENVVFTFTSFTIEVYGEVADIVDFVSGIAIGDDFTTTSVEVVNISVPEPLTLAERDLLLEEEAEASQEGEEIEEPESPSAVIRVNIYSYEGE
jgi:hypothetical protein